MRNLRKGSRGPDVGKLQSFLRSKGYYIKVDNDYGPATRACVKWYQRNEGLYVDGKFGPACRRSMNNAGRCRYQEFQLDRQTTVVRMNRGFTKAKVLHPKKRMTIRSMWKYLTYRQAKVVVNGTLFDTKTGITLSHLKHEGKQVGVGYFDDDGLRMTRDGKVSIGKDAPKFWEFMGFSPAVYLEGNPVTENAGLSSAFRNSKHPRTMIQLNKEYINVFIVRGRSAWRRWFGANMAKLKSYTLLLAKYDETKATDSGNFDGGGSTGAYTSGGYVIGWASRPVANAVAFFVEGF